ncbi:pimeloyl-[acyl-carrier protein] methyl ester esterase [Lihuaxuella thermophila]|uniref:Pimeloyl-[acyl-carrier protein] methyl ester esterase n=1 Tax=Lihuaxuella thermophila TaxID=1173111 RepID=A0A1H8CCR3_9BACL|nr:pimeloyl-[acyl-carrier protein] methyl ester esterase [Lihuaxuella thermophila]
MWLSGWSVSAEIWQPFIREFPGVRHQAIDFCDCEQREEILPKAKEALQTLDSSRVVLIGWSLGAMAALELAYQFPDRIEALFLIGATGKFVRSIEEKSGWDERVLKRMMKAVSSAPAQVIGSFDQRMFSASELESGWLNQWQKRYRRRLPPVTPLLSGLEYLQHFSVYPAVRDIQAPVYLLTGEEDAICPVRDARYLERHLRYGELTVWEETGHLCFWTERDRFHHWLEEKILECKKDR